MFVLTYTRFSISCNFLSLGTRANTSFERTLTVMFTIKRGTQCCRCNKMVKINAILTPLEKFHVSWNYCSHGILQPLQKAHKEATMANNNRNSSRSTELDYINCNKTENQVKNTINRPWKYLYNECYYLICLRQDGIIIQYR